MILIIFCHRWLLIQEVKNNLFQDSDYKIIHKICKKKKKNCSVFIMIGGKEANIFWSGEIQPPVDSVIN